MRWEQRPSRGWDDPHLAYFRERAFSRDCLENQDKPYSGLLRVIKWSQKRHFTALSATTYACLRALQRIFRQSRYFRE